MNHDPTDPPRFSRATQAIIGYAIFGLAWVLLSDQALLVVAPDVSALSTLGLWKGIAFVLMSSLMLYWMLRPAAGRSLPPEHGSASPGRLLLIFAGLSSVIVFAGLAGIAQLSDLPPAPDMRVQMLRRSAWVAAVQVLALAVCASMLVLMWQRRELRVAAREREQQHATKQALQLLDGIANGSTDAIYALDRDMRFLFVNEEVCRVLGRTREQVLGHDATSFFPPEQGECMRRSAQAIMRAGHVVHHEGTVPTASGPRFYLDTLGPLRASAAT
jgi:PAS domain S-box-containing protein